MTARRFQLFIAALLIAAGCETTTTPAPRTRLAPIPAEAGPRPIVAPVGGAVAPVMDDTRRSQEVALLAALYRSTIERRQSAGVPGFVLTAPQGPAATKVGILPLSDQTRRAVLEQIGLEVDRIAWDGDTIGQMRLNRLREPGQLPVEHVFVEFDWISPDFTTVRAITHSVGSVRAAFRRQVAQWTAAGWVLTDAKPGFGW